MNLERHRPSHIKQAIVKGNNPELLSAAGRRGAQVVNERKAAAKAKEAIEEEMLAVKRAEEAETEAIKEFQHKRETGEDGIAVDVEN